MDSQPSELTRRRFFILLGKYKENKDLFEVEKRDKKFYIKSEGTPWGYFNFSKEDQDIMQIPLNLEKIAEETSCRIENGATIASFIKSWAPDGAFGYNVEVIDRENGGFKLHTKYYALAGDFPFEVPGTGGSQTG